MNSWRGTCAAAQITGIVLSTLVWIVVWGLSLPALALSVAVGVFAVAGRNTRAMLWWRYGATPAIEFRRNAILEAIVPIASLRGRNQPTIWIGRRLGAIHAIMPTRKDLVVSPELLRRVVTGQLADRQASAIISQALGRTEVNDSVLVNWVEAYCLPWRFVQIFTGVASRLARHHTTLGISWKIRWIVFGLAAVDAYRNSRWAALVGVILIAVLSWSTSHFEDRWRRELQGLADRRAIAENLGPDLADLLQRGDRSLAAAERAERLRRSNPYPCDRADGSTLEAAPSGRPRDRRTCGGTKRR